MINLRLNTTTALYVGAKNVYLSQVKQTLFGLRLVKFGKTGIEATASADEAAQMKATKEAIKRVLRENNVTTKRVVMALPGKDVLIRHFQMPKIPRPEWETAIKFEAKKYVPFKIEELQWDFHVVLPKGKSPQMDVVFAAVKKKIVQKYLSLLDEAGLKVLALEPAPFSLLRLFGLSNQLAKDKPTAIVDIDYGMADINIVKNRIGYITRDATLPQEEEVLFDILFNEIRMSLDYFEKLFPTQVVGKILLSGEMRVEDWAKKLAQDLNLPVEVANFSKVLKTKKTQPPLNMAVALGLALRGIAPAVAEVNLFRVRKVKPKVALPKRALIFTPELRILAFRALVLSCVAFLILHLVLNRRIVQEKKQIDFVVSLRPKTTLPISSFSYAKLKELKEDLDEKLSSLNVLIDKRVFLTDKLNELPKVIPTGVWLTDLLYSDELSRGNQIVRSLTIKGVAYHEDPVQEIGILTGFVSELKNNELFSQGFRQIKLESMTSATLEGMAVKNFTISCVN